MSERRDLNVEVEAALDVNDRKKKKKGETEKKETLMSRSRQRWVDDRTGEPGSVAA
jgi:hypothetical protein